MSVLMPRSDRRYKMLVDKWYLENKPGIVLFHGDQYNVMTPNGPMEPEFELGGQAAPPPVVPLADNFPVHEDVPEVEEKKKADEALLKESIRTADDTKDDPLETPEEKANREALEDLKDKKRTRTHQSSTPFKK